jgi:threonine synthase
MNYTSTRNSKISITAADAIVKGISEEGGLFVPEKLTDLPKFKTETLQKLSEMSYNERAAEVLRPLLGFSEEELLSCIDKAYSSGFSTIGVTRNVKLDDTAGLNQSTIALELWHGPTAAFKDMALQILPELMRTSAKLSKARSGKTIILVATSGDTGKAALEGFKDVEGIEIAVFYPEDGVSDIQKLQMQSQEGENVRVYAVKGNFDDCQNAVKAVFTDSEVVKRAERSGVTFSSANSINWGRLCPQIVYYVSAYAQLVREKVIRCGDKINICVPTGNFGNILAAYYAGEMGVPVEKLICASNTNNILTDFINTGVYDINRDFHTTVSPSMDILISSNLERLLYHLCGNDDKQINEWFTALKDSGRFEVDAKMKKKLKTLFYAGWASEIETGATIKRVFNEHGYLMDTHTAVGHKVLQDYNENTSKSRIKTLLASTANPYKFGDSVYEALYPDLGKYTPVEVEIEVSSQDEAAEEPTVETRTTTVMDELEKLTGICVPKSLSGINEKQVRFTEVLDKSQIRDAVLKIL